VQISEARFFLVAAGLHLALPLMALLAPLPSFRPFEGEPIEFAVEVEITETRPPTPESVAAARTETPRAEETPQPARIERPNAGTNVEPGPLPTAVPSVEPQTSGEPAPAPLPAKTSEYDGPPPAVQIGPTSGLPGIGSPAWAIPGAVPDMGKPAPAPTTAATVAVDPKIATRVLKDAIREKDKGLGLDLPAGGTVASSVKAAVQATNTPPEARATFEIRLSATGQVLSVRVTSSSGGSSEEWARAASAAAAALKGRTLAMTSDFAKGAVVYVNVQSLLTLPDGSKSAIQQKGAGATFDVSNIGAHQQRVVRTSFSVVASK
jgi:hypothetical protein